MLICQCPVPDCRVKQKNIVHIRPAVIASLTRAALASPAERARLEEGGGGYYLLANSRTSSRSDVGEAAFESSQRLLFQGIFFFLKRSQVRSRSGQRSNPFFCLTGYRDGINNSCKSKLCQNTSQGMEKLAYKYGDHAKYRPRSRSEQIRSPDESVAWVSCEHVSRVIWGAEFEG